MDNFGDRLGLSWRETDADKTDLDTLLADLLEGQFKDPVRIVAFNTAEGWSRDASGEIADLLASECARDGFDIPPFLRSFVEQNRQSQPQ
jgi:hypothetical protein